jgi:hypothetical protein
MERTLTLWVDINRLSRSDASGLVLRMMMAANDIALANWGLTEFKKPQPRLSRHMQNGACLYFIRLQCGHLSEALKLVVELNNDLDSKARLERCNETAKQAYSILNGCLAGGVNYQRFTKWVERIRHNVSFHYDPRSVQRALARLGTQRTTCSVTLGTRIGLWRFNLADVVTDSIICRQIFGIPADADLRAEADKMAEFGAQVCVSFLDFAGNYALQFVRDHAQV